MQLRHRQIMLLLFFVVLVVDVISHLKTFHLQTASLAPRMASGLSKVAPGVPEWYQRHYF